MLLWTDGFDKYGSTGGVAAMLDGVYADITLSGAGGPSSAQARTGTYSFLFGIGSVDQFYRRVFGGNKSIIGYGLACYFDILPDVSNSIYLARFTDSDGHPICTLTVDTTGAIQVRTGNQEGTVVGSSAPVLVATAWQQVEMKVAFDDTTGAVEVRVNGITVLNLSNINTDAIGAGVAANVSTGRRFGPLFSAQYYDDIFLWDISGTYNNNFIGDKRVFTLFPSADTAIADWTPDTGSVGYSRINEATPNDSSYIEGGASGDVSEFSVDNLPANVTAVSGIQTYGRMYKTDAGTATVQLALISNSANADGSDRAITTTPTYWMDIFEEDPDTNSAWTRTSVNAMLVRATRTA